MGNTYSQLYVQIVFAVNGRQSLIQPSWEERLYQYITALVQRRNQKMLSINGMPDHIHFLIGLKPTCRISDLVREIKKASNKFIRSEGFCPFTFSWQTGYGAFSYSHSSLSRVIKYIENQKEHHRNKSFKEEYIEFLEEFNLEYKSEYLFKWTE